MVNRYLVAAIVPALALCVEAGAQSCYEVVPMPRSVQMSGTGAFEMSSDAEIAVAGESARVREYAGFLADYMKRYAGVDAEIVSGQDDDADIRFQKDPSVQGAEAYKILVGQDGIVINASSDAGFFYAVQTLRKTLPSVKSEGKLVFPYVEIQDSPRFSYRGAHFDVSRHFYGVEQVKTYIDMMVLHNMNVLHWHLTDDQGWRIEIKKYPELVKVGGMRDETLIGHLNDRPQKYNGQPHGGYYTQEQIKEVVEYAALRNVTVIPEVDLPGHMQAALAAYPELGCTGGPYKVWTKWGVSDDVLCAGNPKVLEFLEDVFDEVLELFPSKYIHIGGDECPKTRWEACPKCQAKAAELGLKNGGGSTKEQKLQTYIMKHVSSYLAEHGRTIIGWDEILEGEEVPGSVVMSWRGEKGGIHAAKLGHDVIMTPNSYLYFDFCQGKDPSLEPLSIGGYIPVETVYNYSPIPKSLNKEQHKRIIGIQSNLWTEYITTFSHAQYMVLPRWGALAENQWNCPDKKNYKRFLDRLESLVDIYDIEGYEYAKHVFNVNATFGVNKASRKVIANLETMGKSKIRYTLDGSVPTNESALYEAPLQIGEDAVLTAAAFRNGEAGNVVKEEISFNRATACEVTLLSELCPRYTYGGAVMLTDGLKGDGVFGSGRWLGFEKEDFDAVIDLGQSETISSVKFNVCVNTADGVFDARKVVVLVSDDAKEYKQVYVADIEQIAQETKEVRTHSCSFPEVAARYVRVVAEAEKVIPSWSWLAGARAFIFVDEMEVGTPADCPSVAYNGKIKPVTGTWINLAWQDCRNDYTNSKSLEINAPELWKTKVRELKEMGIEYLVFMAVANEGKAYYPSKLMPAAYPEQWQSPVSAIMEEAGKLGMKVFLSTGWAESQDDNLKDEKIKARQIEIMEELSEVYADSKAFYGWYLPVEDCLIPVMPAHAVRSVNALSKRARELAPGKKVMISPYGLFAALVNTKLFAQRISELDVDIIAYQDEVGCVREQFPLERLRKNWKSLRQIHDACGIALWANCETFAWEKDTNSRSSALVPASYHRFLAQQIAASEGGADRIVSFMVPGIWEKPSSQYVLGQPRLSNQVYNDYMSWLRGDSYWRTTAAALSSNAASTLSVKVEDSKYSVLLDGYLAAEDTDDRAWKKLQKGRAEVVFNVAGGKKSGKVAVRCLDYASGGVKLPSRVALYVSEDGVNYTLASVVVPEHFTNDRHDAWTYVVLFEDVDLRNPYAKVAFESSSRTYVDEVIFYR